MGNGAGNFGLASTYTASFAWTEYNCIKSADFNKDGIQDLIIGGGGGGLFLYNGNGLGGFASSIVLTAQGLGAISASDINGDGAPDIVAPGHASDIVSVFINQGFGTFYPVQLFSIGPGFYNFPRGVVCADVNNDGHLDIATADAGNGFGPGMSVLLNTGPSTSAYSNAPLICVGQSATLTATGATSYLWNTSSTSPAIVVSPALTTTYTVKGTLAGCVNYAIVTQSVSPCTNILNEDLSKMSAFPNPTKGQFNLEFNSIKQKTETKIFNSLGQLILQKNISSTDKISLSISDQPSGIYFVEVNADGESYRSKVVRE